MVGTPVHKARRAWYQCSDPLLQAPDHRKNLASMGPIVHICKMCARTLFTSQNTQDGLGSLGARAVKEDPRRSQSSQRAGHVVGVCSSGTRKLKGTRESTGQ